jgi:holo-[acyl-carrier protein] synthase
MIYGIGTDILEIARLEAVLARRGDAFVERILGPTERAIFERRRAKVARRGMNFLATRFAAKEALSKALGLGMRAPMSWLAAEILKAPSGKPIVVAGPKLKAWMEQRHLVAHITLTDEVQYAAAFAVVEVTSP